MNGRAREAARRLTNILASATARRPYVPDAFYWPDPNDLVAEQTYVDFLSTANTIRQSVDECSYAFDNGSELPGYTPIFRYALRWTPTPVEGNIPGNSVYLERLELGPMQTTPRVGLHRQLIARNIGRCTFRRTGAGAIQMRLVVYAYDNQGRGIDGQTMRLLTKRQRRDGTSTADREDAKSYELLTSAPLPTLTLR